MSHAHSRVNTTLTSADKQSFLEALRGRSLELSGDLNTDGEWHRCNATNARDGHDDGSYKIVIGGQVPFGLVRNWTDGQGVDLWHGARNRDLTEAEERELAERMATQIREAEEEAKERAAEAAETARTIWRRAQDAPADHPYLVRKKIKPHGVRIRDGLLVVPMYDPNDEHQLVNLQYIHADGSKWFLKYGRTKGCYFRIGDISKRVVVAEGFATGAAIHQATKDCVVVAFSAATLTAVARMLRAELHHTDSVIWQAHERTDTARGLRAERRQSFVDDIQLVIAADDDWKQQPNNPGLFQAIAAARTSQALVAIPAFGKKRKDKDTDFADLLYWSDGQQYILKQLAKAIEPNAVIERMLADDPHTAFGEAMVQELAGLKQHDLVFYEKLVLQLKNKDIRIRELDGAVKKAVSKLAARHASEPATPPPDIDALAESARHIIDSEDVLDIFAEDVARNFAGEKKNLQLLYLICTSRLLDDTMHGKLAGPSAVGKSKLRDSVIVYMPPEDVIAFTSLSEKALLYIEGDFAHKILSLGEAQQHEEAEFQDYLIRELISANKLRHMVVQKTEFGMSTITIEKNGPVVFLVTTTATKLNPENETRLLPIEPDDSEAQTKRVLRKIAELEGSNRPPSNADDYREWHDYQRWLAAGDRQVVVPFADTLATMLGGTRSVRLRRDFSQLLRAIRTHALMHRQHRPRGDGAIVATIHDYKMVKWMMADTMATTAELKVRKETSETVEVLQKLEEEEVPRDRSAREYAEAAGFSVNIIADHLKLDSNATWRRLKAAQDRGLVVNLERQRGRPGRYRTTGEWEDSEDGVLPGAEALQRTYDEDRERDREHVEHRHTRSAPVQSRKSKRGV